MSATANSSDKVTASNQKQSGIYISQDQESQQCLENLNKNYTWKKKFQTWKNSSSLADLEFTALSSVTDLFRSTNPNIETKILDTEIDYLTEQQSQLVGKNKEKNYIHELSISNKEHYEKETHQEIVLVHGYGASLGLFYNNFKTFSEMQNTSLHALDLLGFGLSSRPKFPKRKGNDKLIFNHNIKKSVKDKDGNMIYEVVNEDITMKTSLEDVEAAENFFVDSLESWRRAKGIQSFTLIGHSLGGYLSCCYAMKYPERVEKLVLLSPVGLETSAFDLSEYQDGRKYAAKSTVSVPDLDQEFELLHENMAKSNNNSFLKSDQNGHVETLSAFPGFFRFIWKNEISPFTFVRKLGFLGPDVMCKWSFTRFMTLKDEDKIMKMHEYCYANFSGKGSGEYCLPRILGPAVLAYHPLLKRVPGKLKCDSLWVYGDSDWMNSSAGAAMCNKINGAGNHKADFEIISHAGHHLYLDNPDEFNELISKYLQRGRN